MTCLIAHAGVCKEWALVPGRPGGHAPAQDNPASGAYLPVTAFLVDGAEWPPALYGRVRQSTGLVSCEGALNLGRRHPFDAVPCDKFRPVPCRDRKAEEYAALGVLENLLDRAEPLSGSQENRRAPVHSRVCDRPLIIAHYPHPLPARPQRCPGLQPRRSDRFSQRLGMEAKTG